MLIPRNSKVLMSYFCLIMLNVILLYYSTNIFRGLSSTSVEVRQAVVQENYRVNAEVAKQEESQSVSSNKKKLNILLFTSFRSGSSYVGHLFASNPKIFYMFEPLSVFNPEIDEGIKKEIKNVSDQQGYKCINQSPTCRIEYLYNCQLLQFFREALFRTPNQENAINSWYDRIFAEVQRNTQIKAREVALDNFCNDRYEIVTAKIIRAKYLKDVVPLMKNGLKVIYLVRDPRGVLNSRRKLFSLSDEAFTKNMVEECEKYTSNIDFLMEEVTSDPELQELFHQNFVFVRYEDVSQDLYGYAKKLYQFVGLDLPTSVEDFAKSNAKVGLWGRPDIKKEQPGFDEAKTLIPWRTMLPFDRVAEVQSGCERPLQHFGYTPIKEAKDLQDISHPVIGKVDESFPCYLGL